MIDKHALPSRLLWVDLEMTGLDPKEDVILEVAAEITDFNFVTLASYEARIQHPHQLVAERMRKNIWWKGYPENRDEFLQNLDSARPSEQVEQELMELVDKHFNNEPAILAGNSIHNDRGFISQWWPGLDLKLHYRMLDVSSWKVFMQGRYGEAYDKPEVHRAFDDIQASIAELQYYLEWFKQHGEA